MQLVRGAAGLADQPAKMHVQNLLDRQQCSWPKLLGPLLGIAREGLEEWRQHLDVGVLWDELQLDKAVPHSST